MKRENIKLKYGGRCAYSGTQLEDDWQIDHVKPILRGSYLEKKERHNFDNVVPCQKIINHYKSSYSLEQFRTLIITLPERIAKLPANPRTEKSKKHKSYMLKLYNYFADFDTFFYFEKT